MSPSAAKRDPFAPPDDGTVNEAIADYAKAVRQAYGDRVKGIYLFGSRARGDHTPESDVDIAVVLADGSWDFWAEKMLLTDLTYQPLVESGVDLQGWPVRQAEWLTPERHHNPSLIRAMQRDARPIGTRR
jgi:antitoxin ChpS